ncbi:MAG: sensor domain-containing diguanylate cyclase [Clostridiales bacterium]|nr:sensor domain-containing diguanylate cyclase [Clostridiales bacterium]
MDKSLYNIILNGVRDGVYYVDKERSILFWNDAAERITGYKKEDVINTHCYENILNHIDEKGNKLCLDGCPLKSTISDGKTREVNVYLKHKDGYRVPVSIYCSPIYKDGKIVGAVESFTDISPHNVILGTNNELVKQAYTDVLTGLPNRRYLEKHLEAVMLKNKQLNIPVGVACVDIDFFKRINDKYGHDVGDKVLKLVSSVFTKAVRDNDIIARNGGEEFTGVFEGLDEKSLKRLLERIRVLVESSSIVVNGENLSTTISIGGAMLSEEDSAASIIKKADNALYEAKETGRNKVVISNN